MRTNLIDIYAKKTEIMSFFGTFFTLPIDFIVRLRYIISMINEEKEIMMITVGMKVWGPKKCYLGEVVEIMKRDFGVTFARVKWGMNTGLGNEAITNVDRLIPFTK